VKFLSGLGERLREGLRRSQEYLAGSLGAVLETDRPVDDALLEELEELLIAADLGAPMAADFTNRAREEVVFGTVTRAGQLKPLLRRFLIDTLAPAAQPLNLDHRPAVVLLLGVNGSGKTTTAAKLAASRRPTRSARRRSSSSSAGVSASRSRSSDRRRAPTPEPSSSTRSRPPPPAPWTC